MNTHKNARLTFSRQRPLSLELECRQGVQVPVDPPAECGQVRSLAGCAARDRR